MTGPETAVAAERWAATLDDDDFDTLPGLMTATCVYDSPSGRIVGRDPIVTSYRSNSEWAHQTFDHVTWRSSVDVEDAGTALITFIDLTDHGGIHHEYRCRQRIWLDGDGLVEKILHIDIEGETEALNAFFERVGVTRPGT